MYCYAQHAVCSMCFRIHAHHSCASYATITSLRKRNKNAIQNWDVTNCEIEKWSDWSFPCVYMGFPIAAIHVMEFWNVNILMCNNFTYIFTHSNRGANFWLIFVQFGIIQWVLLTVLQNIWIRRIEVTSIQLCWCKLIHTNLNWIGLDWNGSGWVSSTYF